MPADSSFEGMEAFAPHSLGFLCGGLQILTRRVEAVGLGIDGGSFADEKERGIIRCREEKEAQPGFASTVVVIVVIVVAVDLQEGRAI
jgi:hypothetical protein